jgi:hypothetical protein
VPQVVPNGGQFCAAAEGMRSVRVAHPVRAGTAQFVRERCVVGLDRFRGEQEEASHHHPKAHAADGRVAVSVGTPVETADDRCRRIPVHRQHRQAAFGEIPRECFPRERRQRVSVARAPSRPITPKWTK